MRIFFFLAAFSCSQILFAQDATVQSLKGEAAKTIAKEPTDTSHKNWITGGKLSLNLSQGSLSNWAAGGDQFSLSLNSFVNLHAYYKKGKNAWDNSLDLNLGYVKTTSLGSRKNDDRIDFLSKYGYELNPKLSIAGLFNFRSQFFDGFSYDASANKTLSSAFLSPAYIIVSPGLDYHPIPNFKVFISPVTERWVIVKDDTLSAQGAYGVTPGKNSLNEVGAFATISYTYNLNSILTYTGRLDLFSNYRTEPQNVDVYMSNLFTAKLSKILSASYSLDLIYDDNARLFGPNNDAPRTQLKSLIGVGLLVKL